MENSNEIIIIKKEKDYFSWEEIYCKFYNCKKCNEMIVEKDKYCSNCGIKIVWEE